MQKHKQVEVTFYSEIEKLVNPKTVFITLMVSVFVLGLLFGAYNSHPALMTTSAAAVPAELTYPSFEPEQPPVGEIPTDTSGY